MIIDGEPGCPDGGECFPPALRFEVDAEGHVTDRPAEPVAADAREHGDGKRGALLKLAAGLLGVKLDDLVQRDAARRARNAQARRRNFHRARLADGRSIAVFRLQAARRGGDRAGRG